MNNLFHLLLRLNGEELRNLLRKVAKVRDGKVAITVPVSEDYEKYQLKNDPNTVDIAVTVVMGAPFPDDFSNSLRRVIKKLEVVFKPYDVTLHAYANHHIHATVSPIIRTTFDHVSYRIDPDAVNQKQREEIQNTALDTEQIKKATECTQPFSINVSSWDIKIGGRGQILLWAHANGHEGARPLERLRERLRKIVGSHARDKGSKVHITLGTVHNFHKLTGLQKKEIACKINREIESISVPDSVHIDRVKLVRYLHRSLSKVKYSEEFPFC